MMGIFNLFKKNNEKDNLIRAIGHTSLGNRLGSQDKLDDAIKAFRKAIKFKRDYIPAYLGLAVAYREKGLLNKALELLKKLHEK